MGPSTTYNFSPVDKQLKLLDGSAMTMWLKNSKKGTEFGDVYDKMQLDPNPYYKDGPDSLLNEVLRKGDVTMASLITAMRYKEEYPCKIHFPKSKRRRKTRLGQ